MVKPPYLLEKYPFLTLLRVLLPLLLLKACGATPLYFNFDFTSASLDPTITGFMITGNLAGDQFGYSATTAGDINNDGYDDIIIGAYGKNSYKGAVYVVYGGEKSSLPNIDLSSTTLDPLNTGFIMTVSTLERLGITVSSAGDINGDGYGDLIVGARGKSSQTGVV